MQIFELIGLAVVVLAVWAAGRVWLLKRDLAGFAKYWLAENAKPAAEGSLWYVALGDSAAQGIGASRPRKGYVGLLARRLNEATGRPVHIINLSVSGAKAQDVLRLQLPRLKQLAVPKGSIITLAVGGNDVRGFEPSEFRAVMKRLLAQLPAQTVVADVPYFGGGRANGGEHNAARASAIIAELAQTYKLPFARLHQFTKQAHSPRNFGADFFHPSNRGYRNWVAAFWQTLEPTVDAQSDGVFLSTKTKKKAGNVDKTVSI